ncbi:MAG: zinc metalloprotease HtpX [Actinomycetota bacterium]|nr:zinc metalloprotease HtpX [Actinomycetota bacterium]MDH5223346.1 zinc metalloprotease HtpX [Actinomycetota bacterium]MDH5312412.1 zinc metalloprotease HtpX [Actinomycetota bacterium]
MTPGINRAKTWMLIAALMGLFLVVGALLGGRAGMTFALVMGLAFNLAMYWWSGSIAVRSTRSREVSEQEYPQLYRIVRELTQLEGMPMPGIYVSDMQQPNAFATGRNPQNAKVAVTKGILQILDERELRGVLAHELSHVANRDILVGSVAAAIGTAISYLAWMALWVGGDDDGGSPIVALLAWLLAPIAAGLIQMAVSRSREFQADESGAFLSRDPQALASALQKLEETSRRVPPPHSLQPGEAHMFIVNPLAALKSRGISSLFSSHPPTSERVARLMAAQDEILRRQGPIGR